jgi:SAM-dependent methyltransferase
MNVSEQTALWNGVAGCAWVDAQGLLDDVFRPLEQLLVDAIADLSGGRVLDVGCGTGGTTVAVARRLGAKGQCVGIDISEPMLAAARARAEREGINAVFIRADAQTHAFEPDSFDTIMSRFGVMFFDDPVRAFANLRRAARDAAELRLIVWRGAADNPFMTTAERAAAALLPLMPTRDPDGPGQFAFADDHRLHHILKESGWSEIDIQPIDVACTLPEKELVGYFTRFGPVGRMFPELDDQTRTRIVEAVRPAFDPYVRGAEAHFTAACWMVKARANQP